MNPEALKKLCDNIDELSRASRITKDKIETLFNELKAVHDTPEMSRVQLKLYGISCELDFKSNKLASTGLELRMVCKTTIDDSHLPKNTNSSGGVQGGVFNES